MENLVQKKLDILIDTMHFYSKNTRAAEDSIGFYIDTEGNRCAIGRLVDDNTARTLTENVTYISSDEQFRLLPKELQSLGKRFLQHLQDFHDDDRYWNSQGISTKGMNYFLTFKKEIMYQRI